MRITQTELNEILKLNEMWRNGLEGGVKADLSGLDAEVIAPFLERSLDTVQWAKYTSERVPALDEYHAVVDAAYDEYRSMPNADTLAKYQSARNAARAKYKSIRDALLIRILTSERRNWSGEASDEIT